MKTRPSAIIRTTPKRTTTKRPTFSEVRSDIPDARRSAKCDRNEQAGQPDEHANQHQHARNLGRKRLRLINARWNTEWRWAESAERALRPEMQRGPDGHVSPGYRPWYSVMAPISLQLLEAAQRVAEGQRAVGRCRECGQPFLRLDGRRESFCNTTERNRYNSRERYRTGRMKGFGFPEATLSVPTFPAADQP